MLSRVADAIFWMSRYMERTKMETTLLYSNYVAIQDNAIDENWKFIMEYYSNKELQDDHKKEAWLTAESLSYLIVDKNNPSSIVNNIMYARENARSIQDHITKELWQTLNNYYHIVRDEKMKEQILSGDPVEVMDVIHAQCYLFYGTLDSTMDRGPGYYFMNVGKHLERALQTIQVLLIKIKEVKYNLMDETELVSFRYLLYALSGYELYGKTYRGAISATNIIDYTLFNPIFTHSVSYSLDRIKHNFLMLKSVSTPVAFSQMEFEIGKLISNFTYNQPEIKDGKKMCLYLEELHQNILNISTLFSKHYFGQI